MELSKGEYEDNQNQKQQQVVLDVASIFHMFSAPEEGKNTNNLKFPNQVSKLMPVFTLAIKRPNWYSKAGHGLANTSLKNQESSSVHESSTCT